MPFYDVISHANIIEALQSSLINNTLAHAYLFVGSSGIGKKKLALEFAKAINCLKNNSDACEDCSSCKKINLNTHPDVHLIESDENNITIEIVRDIEKNVALKPFEGKKKIYIIEDADRLLVNSANAFLKTLEEPPLNTIFILITSNLKGVLSTIISRCQIVRFGSMDEENIKKYLEKNFNLDTYKALTLARLAEGRIGNAIEFINGEKAKERDVIFGFLKQIPEISLLNILTYANFFSALQMEINYILDIYFVWFRDILMVKIGKEESIINLDYLDSLKKVESHYTNKQLININKAIDKIRYNIKRNVNLLLAWEVLLLEIKENTN
ncbi:DNA polymerase III subunit delta' [Candidatus Poribacteria bacterium]|nr:DNA polymerase III subunit delta' [Candidatus Poribacteria bacterium]